MKFVFRFVPCSLLGTALMLPAALSQTSAAQTTSNINTLAGKVASVNGTAGLQIRFSAFIE
jgi:branched-subunit amino acid transport protein